MVTDNSSMIGKIDKAKRYAQERGRVHFDNLAVTFDGDNGTHNVTFDGHAWHCDCNFFQSHQVCSHTMALERVLDQMVPASSVVAG